MLGDTIAAISTPQGKGGVALLRVSGPRAIEICADVFVPKNQKPLSDAVSRMAIYGSILAPEEDGTFLPVDDGIATVFRSPASFTGEDTVEICCHGGILLTQTVLSALFAAGARPAEAGEFTKRAFLNGKLGLSSAEALGNLLEAQTKEQLTLAHSGMHGRVEARCQEIYDSLCVILASIYAKIDYPDEDLADMSREEMITSLGECEAKVLSLSETYRTGHAIAEGIPTVICGRPNVGKSSLYNRILGRDAAIVTSVEGTTRDILSDRASLGRVTLRLFDTAGLHETENEVEKIGIERARAALHDAELVFAVFDGSQEPNEEDLAIAQTVMSCQAPVIAILNKSDLGHANDSYYRQRFSNVVTLSAENGAGIDQLTALVEELFTDGALDTRNDAVLTNARQQGAALSALAALRRCLSGLRAGVEIDLCCTDVEDAMQSIAQIDGRAVSEDIVSRIFSHFCVGK